MFLAHLLFLLTVPSLWSLQEERTAPKGWTCVEPLYQFDHDLEFWITTMT